MDTQKALRLINKIQALLEPNATPELSRLEKDLLKSYILQLYETVHDEPHLITESQLKSYESTIKPKLEIPHEEKPPMQIREQKIEVPTVNVPEVKPVKPVDIPIEIKYPEAESMPTPPKIEYKPVYEPVKEPVRKPLVHHEPKDISQDEALEKLFDPKKGDDISDRFSHVPITNIEASMGLNERIFTLKELFGGDRDLFEKTCAQLNAMHSFHDARALLLNGVARDQKWGQPDRIKMAEQFIRIVSRRYPKS